MMITVIREVGRKDLFLIFYNIKMYFKLHMSYLQIVYLKLLNSPHSFFW